MKKLLVALAVGVAVFAAAYASAATLGGLGTDDLGSDDSVVASCDKVGGVITAYETSYNTTEQTYVVDKVDVSSIDATCAGQRIKVTLTDNSSTPVVLGSGGPMTVTVAPGTTAVPITGVSHPVHAEDVYGLHILISTTAP
ncbi:MAG: hypothetical protein K1X87_07240 [Dehalococcoidia bacterium]|nr:hypothetical protein [Dehalococcoidia bacterium]